MRWFFLNCMKEQCLRLAGWGGAAGARYWQCPHVVKVRWRPDTLMLVCCIDNRRTPGGGMELYIRGGKQAVDELQLALTGIASISWYVRWRLNRQMRHTFRALAEMKAVRAHQEREQS